jgi:hypothetical protein
VVGHMAPRVTAGKASGIRDRRSPSAVHDELRKLSDCNHRRTTRDTDRSAGKLGAVWPDIPRRALGSRRSRANTEYREHRPASETVAAPQYIQVATTLYPQLP